MRKKEILSFVTTQINLKDVMLSEISQTEPNAVLFHLYVESKKKKKVELTETEKRMVVTHGYRVG